MVLQTQLSGVAKALRKSFRIAAAAAVLPGATVSGIVAASPHGTGIGLALAAYTLAISLVVGCLAWDRPRATSPGPKARRSNKPPNPTMPQVG